RTPKPRAARALGLPLQSGLSRCTAAAFGSSQHMERARPFKWSSQLAPSFARAPHNQILQHNIGLSLLYGSAYMSPRMSSPRRSFFFSFSLLRLSLFPPRRRLSPAPTAYSQGRRAQMLSRLAASSAATTLWRAWPLQQSSTTARLDGSGSSTL